MKVKCNLLLDRIERLEEIGFKWQVLTDYDEAYVSKCFWEKILIRSHD
jgi:hypothetical protein